MAATTIINYRRVTLREMNILFLYVYRYYDYMGRGDFILYRNTERHFEVRNISESLTFKPLRHSLRCGKINHLFYLDDLKTFA